MLIYILLVILILVLPLIVSPFTGGDEKKTQQFTALFGVLAIYIVLALKSPSVGIDMKGYEEQYYLSRYVDWNNYNYVYYENGYIFLEKLFSHMGLSFQWFTGTAYFVECLALFLLIKRFSMDAQFSLTFFVCYQFFVFSTSGLRQTIAFSLCAYAVLLFCRKKRWTALAGVVLIITASTIHSSAVIFFIIPLLMLVCKRFRSVSWFELITLAVGFLLRGALRNYVNSDIRKIEADGGISLSGNLIFLSVVAVFCLFTYQMYYGVGLAGSKRRGIPVLEAECDFFDTLVVRVSVLSVGCFILLSGSVMLRGLMYINLLLVPLLPNMIQKYTGKQRLTIKAVLMLMFMMLFYFHTLSINQLSICPYRFFWQTL